MYIYMYIYIQTLDSESFFNVLVIDHDKVTFLNNTIVKKLLKFYALHSPM